MIKLKKTKLILKKKTSRKKNLSQSKLTQLTWYPGYKIRLTQQKKKTNNEANNIITKCQMMN